MEVVEKFLEMLEIQGVTGVRLDETNMSILHSAYMLSCEDDPSRTGLGANFTRLMDLAQSLGYKATPLDFFGGVVRYHEVNEKRFLFMEANGHDSPSIFVRFEEIENG